MLLVYFYYGLLVFFIIFILILLYYYVSVLISLIRSKGVPYIPSFDSDIKLMKELKVVKPGKTMIDLGCGDGKILRFFIKEFGLAKCYGYDLSGFAINYGRIINYFKKFDNIKLVTSNFKKANLTGIDYVFVYLMPNVLEDIEDWLFDSIGEDTLVISNTFQFKKHQPFEVVKNSKGCSKILVYKKD